MAASLLSPLSPPISPSTMDAHDAGSAGGAVKSASLHCIKLFYVPKLTYSDRGESKHSFLFCFSKETVMLRLVAEKAGNNEKNIKTHVLEKTEMKFSFPSSSFLITKTCSPRRKDEGDDFLGDFGFQIQRVSVVRSVWVNSTSDFWFWPINMVG